MALARSTPGPPGTTIMSTGPSPSSEKVQSTCMRSPWSQVATTGSAATVPSWYSAASASSLAELNACQGPARSSG